MAPPQVPIPPLDELVKLAPEHLSLASLARSIGVRPGTLAKRLGENDPEGRVKAALKRETRRPVAPAELPEEVSEVEVLRQRVKDLEAVERRDRKNKVYDERLTQAVEAAVATRKSVYKPAPIPRSKPSEEKHEFVLLWSDLHAGEVVSREETGGLNSYDWETMLKRHDKLRESLFSYQDNRPYPIEKLHVFGLGDMLSGDIHDELVATNEIPLADATCQLGQDGAVWLESLTERFPFVQFSGVVGNHPRAHKKPWAKQGYDNADWTAYRIMEIALRKNERISFDIPKANLLLTTVAGRWNCLLGHGDGVRSSMPGVPWGGLMRRVNSLSSSYDFDVFCVGHFHSANLVESNHGRIAMNGSVKGVDEYVLKAFGGGSKPQQLLLTFHPRHGLTDASLIDLA